MTKPFRIAIAGLGTVGTGVVKILQEHADLVASRAGRPIEIVAVSARDRHKTRAIDVSAYHWVDDPADLADIPDIDAIVELIGGTEGVARTLIETALTRGRAVVTANKALLAHHGYELARCAEEAQTDLRYEAAVAGGIPIIKTIREGFASNKITGIFGILNGTCNYILTEMRETGRDFADVLQEAQAHGYAEADPTFDVDGIDAGHKLCLLSSLVFGIKPAFDAVDITGIRHVSVNDIRHAGELGYKLKLLGTARMINGNIIQSVEPCLVPQDSQLGSIEGVFNAVLVEGDYVGQALAVGRGAGEGPTASAVVADLIDLARGLDMQVFGVPVARMGDASWASAGHIVGCFYLHLVVHDKPGVLADITAIMRDYDISIEAVLQRGQDTENPVSVVIKTHRVRQGVIRQAAEKIGTLPVVTKAPVVLRIEDFS